MAVTSVGYDGPTWPRLCSLMGIMPHLRSSNRLSCYLTPNSVTAILGGGLRGVTSRTEIEHALTQQRDPSLEKAVVCRADQTLQQVEPHMIESASGLFLVTETEGGPIVGLFTLHNLLRAQAALLD
jgi:hypothetical protein